MSVQLDRENLHAKVWSLPLAQLAAQLGISIIDMKNACHTLQIPTPPHGHWNRVRAGTEFTVPSLLPYSGPNSITVRSVKSKYAALREPEGTPAAPSAQSTSTKPVNLPRFVTLKVWAQMMFGERAPHVNTLRRWVNDGRISPRPQKIGKTWFVKSNAEYMD